MTTSVRLYQVFHTELADAVLPGDDHFARERRAALSEMLVGMLRDGVPMNLFTVGDRLSTFVPLQVLESTGIWKELKLKRWMEQTRPEIFKALGDYFIEGGHEARVEHQKALLDALETGGVQIHGRDVLEAALPWSGDWKKRFLAYALLGRPEGVLFYGSLADAALVSRVRHVLRNADFDREQIDRFCGGLRLEEQPAIYLGIDAFPESFWGRLWRRLRRQPAKSPPLDAPDYPVIMGVSGPLMKVWLRKFLPENRRKIGK